MVKKTKKIDVEKYERFLISELIAAREVLSAIRNPLANEIAEVIETRKREWGDLTYAREIIDNENSRYDFGAGRKWVDAIRKSNELTKLDLDHLNGEALIEGRQSYFVLKYKKDFERARGDKNLSMEEMPLVYQNLIEGFKNQAKIYMHGFRRGWVGIDKKDLDIYNYVPRLMEAKKEIDEMIKEWEGKKHPQEIEDAKKDYDLQFKSLAVGFALGALEEDNIKLAKEIFDKIGIEIKEENLKGWTENKEKYLPGIKEKK